MGDIASKQKTLSPEYSPMPANPSVRQPRSVRPLCRRPSGSASGEREYFGGPNAVVKRRSRLPPAFRTGTGAQPLYPVRLSPSLLLSRSSANLAAAAATHTCYRLSPASGEHAAGYRRGVSCTDEPFTVPIPTRFATRNFWACARGRSSRRRCSTHRPAIHDPRYLLPAVPENFDLCA